MTIKGDRQNIFPGNTVSHRGKTITDIGSSKQYISFVNRLQNAERSRIAVVPNNMEGRPDLIAYAAYGNEQLWWVIVEANNVYDYEVDLGAGKQILIPNL